MPWDVLGQEAVSATHHHVKHSHHEPWDLVLCPGQGVQSCPAWQPREPHQGLAGSVPSSLPRHTPKARFSCFTPKAYFSYFKTNRVVSVLISRRRLEGGQC